ncbi:hemerythrin domain-containing protein [Amycolatopsis sp. NPDC059027]|uniref:hemerythrin domain-containing protein n=1 Tax=unclassified Amycolatopsis TaxID=2618356 RepID=UPI0036732F57
MTNSSAPTTTDTTSALPDLTGIRLSHRAILGDIARLAALLSGADARAMPLTRAGAVTTYIHQYNAAVRHHHRNEDDRLWPVIAAAAGRAVDLVPYIGEHEVLDRLQDAADVTAAHFAENPVRHAPRLAALLVEQRDLLIEHIDAEEQHLFPVILRHVSAARYASAEAEIRKSTPPGLVSWMQPWLWRYATADERRLLPPAPVVEPLLAAYTAGETQVFGHAR